MSDCNMIECCQGGGGQKGGRGKKKVEQFLRTLIGLPLEVEKLRKIERGLLNWVERDSGAVGKWRARRNKEYWWFGFHFGCVLRDLIV